MIQDPQAFTKSNLLGDTEPTKGNFLEDALKDVVNRTLNLYSVFRRRFSILCERSDPLYTVRNPWPCEAKKNLRMSNTSKIRGHTFKCDKLYTQS